MMFDISADFCFFRNATALKQRHEGHRDFLSWLRFTSSERAHPHLRNFGFIDEVTWFRLEGAPKGKKGSTCLQLPFTKE